MTAHTPTESPVIFKKNILADPTFLESLTNEDRAGAHSIIQTFEPQRVIIKHFLRLAFTLAGLSWFVIWFPALTTLAPEALATFKVQQYQMYLILMTLWGFDLKMQERRLSALVNLAAALHKKWYQVTLDDIAGAGKLYLFELFAKLPGSEKKYVHIGFIWLLIVLTVLQFIRQGILLFG